MRLENSISIVLLESPTGTGKTLCLLSATFALRKKFGGFSIDKRAWSLLDVYHL